MISDNQMDQIFRNRLENYSSSVPENMWNRILEKKKRDRMLWLFFSRLMIIAALVFGLTGGYLILNQKKVSTNANTIGIQSNHPLVSTNAAKTNQSITNLTQDQMPVPEIGAAGKNGKLKSNTQANYFDAVDHTKKKTVLHDTPSQTENGSTVITTHRESAVIDTTTVKNVKENDSLNKKPLVKTTAADSSKSKEVKKPEKQNNQNNGKWYLDLYASPDYPIVTPQDFGETVSKLSYTIGIKINRTLGKHISVKTGIQYSQINIIGDDSLLTGATLHIKRLDLPVLVGYSLGKGNVKSTINGGIIFNLNSSVSPAFAQNFFENNLGMSLYLGVNFEKRIKEKLSLFVEPYYRYQLSPMTIPSVSNMKFIDIVGISFGARYYFKK